jgi:HEAT repeat protein
LIRALNVNDVGDRDPSIQLSEEVVRNCVAEQLGRASDRNAVGPLLEALQRFHLVGAGEALATLKEPRAIPLMIERLEDPFGRARFGDALLTFGREVQGALIATLSVRRFFRGEEARSSRERRAEAARLLSVLKSREAADPLVERLEDEVPEVRLQAALALCELLQTDDHRIDRALTSLTRDSQCGDLATRDRVFDALVSTAARALPRLFEALEDPELSDDGKVLVIEVLGQIPDARVPGALLSLISNPNRILQQKARWALQRLGRALEPNRRL